MPLSESPNILTQRQILFLIRLCCPAVQSAVSHRYAYWQAVCAAAWQVLWWECLSKSNK